MTEYRRDLRDRCRIFAGAVVRALGEMPTKPGVRTMCDQCIRSAASIGANLVEARGCGTRKEFTKFFRIALKSANETRYWLELMKDVGYGDKETVRSLLGELSELEKMIAAGVLRLQSEKE